MDTAPDALSALLPAAHAFADKPTVAELSALPNSAAVYMLTDAAQRPILLASSQALRRLSLSKLGEAGEAGEPSRRADLAEITRGIRWREVHSRFEADWTFYRAARLLHPKDYRTRIAFGPAWFLHLQPDARVPELRVTERIGRDAGEFIGPFPSRAAAQATRDTMWDLFDQCRFPEQVRQAPHGQRCAYAEMGRCDAPCDGGAPLPRYAERVCDSWRFMQGDAAGWRADAERRMRAAAAELKFEQAAQIKSQMDIAEKWQRQWAGIVRREHDLRALLLMPVVRREAVKPFLFDRGAMAAGEVARRRTAVDEIVAWAKSAMENMQPEPDDRVRMEQTWLFCGFLNSTRAEKAGVVWLSAVSGEDALRERIAAELARMAEVRRRSKEDDDEAIADGEAPPEGQQAAGDVQ
jgi:excinuclease UvrABC nuclease subunit